MRKLEKLSIPDVLRDNHDNWLRDYLADKTDSTKKNRYRHSEIKSTLKEETGWKCVYCESKIGHNSPRSVHFCG